MLQRVVEPELLDSDSGSPAEVRAALADLRWVNRCFGGVRTSRKLLQQVAQRTGKRCLTLLDVAAASGDVSSLAAAELARQGIQVQVTLLDRATTHLPRHGHPALAADAFHLPFSDNTFDVVACSLFVHHLEPPQVGEFANEALRVARIAVLINDLRRSALHLALVYAGRPLFRSQMAWGDGVKSVRRAYTQAELAVLLRTRAADVEISNHYLFRMAATIWKALPVTARG